MGQGESGIERARRDLAEGRPWKARDRLGSYLGAHPADQQALDLLGEVRWTMRDLPAAGAAWFLTERDDERAQEAIGVMRREYARSLNGLLGALNVRLAPDDPAWPRSVAARLRELAVEAERQEIRWDPGASRRALQRQRLQGSAPEGCACGAPLLLSGLVAVAAALLSRLLRRRG